MELIPIYKNQHLLEYKHSGDDIDGKRVLSRYNDFYAVNGYQPPWIGYFILRKNTTIGYCGFEGPPKNGIVKAECWPDLGYRNQGVTTLMTKKLLEMAYAVNPSVTIKVHTFPRHYAGTRILERNGFTFSETAFDEYGDEYWIWTLIKAEK